MSIDISNTLINSVISIARKAGDAIMDIYKQDFSVYEKDDKSPLTEADLAAHNVIVQGLSQLDSQYPVLSEENANISWQERQGWHTYWLVDPLDGTKEFIKKNGEFTVNIALISDGEPVFGVVYAPVLETLYWGAKDHGAFKQTGHADAVAIKPQPHTSGDTWKVVGSRSHPSPDMASFLEELGGEHEMVAMGSSLKLCLVAEGAAHIYPRLGPTCEWDTGAAQAVVEAAGAAVCTLDGAPLRYNRKPEVLNPYFIVKP